MSTVTTVDELVHPLLEQDVLDKLATPVEVRAGYPHQKKEDRTFVFQVDARPLVRLILDASRGQRVYELMSIERPGDLLHYLWVTVPDRLSELAKTAAREYDRKCGLGAPMGDVCHMAFKVFDAGFVYDGDDTDQETMLWLSFKDSEEWRQHSSSLLPVVKTAQANLSSRSDYLVQREIALMRQHAHRQDFSLTVTRYCELESEHASTEPVPPEVFDCIVRLAQREDVKSVSCPFDDFELWRTLIAEQVRRAEAQGQESNEVLRLSGPDSGISFVRVSNYRPDRDWGGEVHIPYEGATGGDLFVQPKWFGFSADAARKARTLSYAVFGNYAVHGFKTCKHLLTRSQTLGEIPCATRTAVGDWFWYEAPEVDSQTTQVNPEVVS